jgi:ABC-type glycerol-3-phosphate transport system substrate-binding protein
MRRIILGTVMAALAAAAGGPGAGASEHQSRCPNGFTLYAVPQTEAEMRALPRIAAGLDATPAPYTVDDLRELGSQIDANGDGNFCLKAVSNLRGQSVTQWGFFYGARDNDTAAS